MSEEPPPRIEPLPELETPASVRQRAVSGVLFVAGRQLLVRVLGLGATLVVARKLGVEDYGTLVFGLTVLSAATFLSDGGLAVGLIRRAEPPTRTELEAAAALQLVLLGVVLAISCLLLVVASGAATVTAVMLAPLPLLAFRTPGTILLERDLAYRELAIIEVAEAAVYQVLSVVVVLAGLGAVGVAAMTAPRILVGTALTIRLTAGRVPVPRWHREVIRPLIGFGMRFQGLNLLTLGRDQALNYAVLAVGGFHALGVWGLTQRLLQVPFSLFQTLWRVSFPAVSSLIRAGGDPIPALRKAMRLCSGATALLLAPMVAASIFLVAPVFGGGYDEAGELLTLMCLGLQISGPISTASAGYLLALPAMRDLYVVEGANAVLWISLTLVFVAAFGPIGVGMAFLVGGGTEAVLFQRSFRARSGHALGAPWRSLLALVLSGTAGYAVGAASFESDVAAGALAAAVSLLLVTVMLRLVDRATWDAVVAMGRSLPARLRG